ncbi:hypothetical protein L1887_23775 [Cichorium endivia]|nr:hypothetical protein L1887_23775 [Cichorium endivia]
MVSKETEGWVPEIKEDDSDSSSVEKSVNNLENQGINDMVRNRVIKPSTSSWLDEDMSSGYVSKETEGWVPDIEEDDSDSSSVEKSVNNLENQVELQSPQSSKILYGNPNNLGLHLGEVDQRLRSHLLPPRQLRLQLIVNQKFQKSSKWFVGPPGKALAAKLKHFKAEIKKIGFP